MDRDYFKVVPAVFLIMEKDNQVLLLRRFNTGWQDGNYSLPAGHLNGEEGLKQAMAREAEEEIGIKINAPDLKFVHLHSQKADDFERVDIFFAAERWEGIPENKEPDKCDDLRWVRIDSLPQNIVPLVKDILESYQDGNFYSETW